MDDITNSKLDLADMLNKVDYSFKDYIPSKDALMFINFIKEVEKDLENKTPISHLMALDHIFKNTKKSLILAHRGFSKCLDINCSINTNEGYKRLEDIKEGDIVLDRYSKETKVLGVSKIHEDKKCYKFILQDKSEFINTFDHINIIYKLENNKFKELIITTEDLVKVFKKQRRLNYFIPIISNPIQYQYKKIDFDTYLYGYFLAKKDIDSNRFLELKNKIINQFSLPLDFIPNYILYNNVNVRISLIQGMLDANGYVNTNGDIVLKLDNNKLFCSLLILFRELSCIVRVVEQKNILIIKNVKFKPFRCKSKLKYYFKYVKEHLDLVGILDIQETDTIKTKCISVESNSKAFVFNNCYITHNTTLLGEYLILFLACFNRYPNFGDINYIMYVSDTIENGVKNLRNNIEYRYANSSFLQQLIPNQPIKLLTYEGGYSSSEEFGQSQGRKFTDVRLEFKNVNNKTLVVKMYGIAPLALDSKLYKENEYTTIGKCKVGDEIYGANGKLVKILAKSEIFNKPTYKINLKDGRSITTSIDHINRVIKRRKYHSYNHDRYTELDMTTEELLKEELYKEYTSHYHRDKSKKYNVKEHLLYFPLCKPIEYKELDLPIDPYTLGLLLGDGSLRDRGSSILTAEHNDMEFYKSVIPYELGKIYSDKRNPHVESVTIKGIYQEICDLGLNGKNCYNKFIPDIYKRSSIHQRLELIRGLLDTDGTISPRKNRDVIIFVSTSYNLVKDLTEIVNSLGGYTYISKKDHRSGFGKDNTAVLYSTTIHLNPIKNDIGLFKLPRKFNKCNHNFNEKDTRIPIISIDKVDDIPTQCILVNSEDHLFVTNDYLITHNTGIRGTKELGVRPQLCHQEGTLVCTELGWHKVEDYYKKGDVRKEKGYEVKVNCTPFTEIVTNDHLYLCGFESKRFVHNKPEFSLIDIQFTKVSNIKLFENNVYICEKIDKEVKDNIDISDDEMRLVSYYYFLGNKSIDNIKFEIDRYDFDTINELKEILENKLNYKYTISQNSFYMIEITLLDYPNIIKEANFDKIELLKKLQYIDINKQKVFLSLLDKISYTYLKSFEELVLLEFISKRCEIPYNITNYDKKDYKYRFIKCLTQSTKYFKEYVLKKIDYVKKSKEYSNFIPIETPSHIYNTMLGTSHNCILDDLLKDKDAKSDTIIEDINEVIYKSISKALHPQKQKMIWLGTPFNFRDPIYEASVSGAWDTKVFPICEKFPCEANEFKGSWEDRFPYDVVKYEYDVAMKQGKPDYFYQELMLQIIPQDNLVVPLDKIRYIDIEATKNPKFNYYITTDLAVRKNATNDQTVISIWAYNNNQDLILVDGFCGRIDPTDFIKKLFTYVSKYKPLEVGIEVTGQQAGFISFIQQEMYNTNVYFTIKEVKPTTDKFSRFLEVSPLYLNGKIYISKNINKEYYNEFIDEISKAVKTGFKSKHDDILDTHSQLLYLEKFAPSEEIFFEKNDEDDKYFLENYDIMSEQITNTIF